MVVIFAVFLTRRSRADHVSAPDSLARAVSAVSAVFAGAAVFGVLALAILKTRLAPSTAAAPTVSVRDIGTQLMGTHAAALIIMGILLTVALLGAVVIASHDGPESRKDVS